MTNKVLWNALWRALAVVYLHFKYISNEFYLWYTSCSSRSTILVGQSWWGFSHLFRDFDWWLLHFAVAVFSDSVMVYSLKLCSVQQMTIPYVRRWRADEDLASKFLAWHAVIWGILLSCGVMCGLLIFKYMQNVTFWGYFIDGCVHAAWPSKTLSSMFYAWTFKK